MAVPITKALGLRMPPYMIVDACMILYAWSCKRTFPTAVVELVPGGKEVSMPTENPGLLRLRCSLIRQDPSFNAHKDAKSSKEREKKKRKSGVRRVKSAPSACAAAALPVPLACKRLASSVVPWLRRQTAVRSPPGTQL